MSAILCPIIAIVVNVVAQIIAFRSRRGTHFFRSVVEGFMAGAIACAIIEIIFALSHGFSKEYWALVFLVNAPIYLALSYCTYNFVQLGQTSIRIRMYSEIAAAPDGIDIEELKREYDDEALMRARLKRLLESGDIVGNNGQYCIGRKRFLVIAAVLFGAKRFLLGRESEFEPPK